MHVCIIEREYAYMRICVYIYIYMCSLIYTHIHIWYVWGPWDVVMPLSDVRKGTNGVSSSGVTATTSCVWAEGLFGYSH